MPLQNRVMPDGSIVAADWRGTFMGNRGGKIHDPQSQTLLKKRWASKRWIICVTEFKNRHRTVMGNSYTELFFLDEVSALAAGHRPCFECRRKAAQDFSDAWITCFGKPFGSIADAIDRKLHEERTSRENRNLTLKELADLPNGIMVKSGEQFYAKYHGSFLQWTETGYRASSPSGENLELLTPASVVSVFKNGYKPVWHSSAK